MHPAVHTVPPQRRRHLGNALLILNAGSSSLKFSLFGDDDGPELSLRGQIDGLLAEPKFRALDASGRTIAERAWERGRLAHSGAIEFLLDWVRADSRGHALAAAGHRVVHGGRRYVRPVLLDDAVLADLEAIVPLAPLHQPHNLAAIRAVSRVAPGLPQIGCFDTAFHATQPPVAQTFAIPRRYTEAGIRRYGFHGLSYEFIAGRLPELDSDAAAGRTIVAHLGNGASMCALQAGCSIATTMGFTTMDGLVMGTRCGAIDPGVLIHLAQREGLAIDEVASLLNEESGLLGVSGVSGDMRTLLASRDPHAAEAVELFVYRAARELGSLAAALHGLDAVVFTGGIGQNAAPIRAAICRASAWLGVTLDEDANAAGGPLISRRTDRVRAWVIPTDEELMIARHAAAVLAGTGHHRTRSPAW